MWLRGVKGVDLIDDELVGRKKLLKQSAENYYNNKIENEL